MDDRVIIAIGLTLAVFSLLMLLLTIRKNKWPKTKGKVLVSKIEKITHVETRSGGISIPHYGSSGNLSTSTSVRRKIDRKDGDNFNGSLLYSYAIDGKEYKGITMFSNPLFGSIDSALNIIPKARHVTCIMIQRIRKNAIFANRVYFRSF